jgi:tRNA (cytidine/uridine-2'-O-)-methyltransferase
LTSTINIVLYQPEIPGNTGNVARLCAVTGASLHLIRPLGFEVSDRALRRAGLDYWSLLDIHYHDDFEAILRLAQREQAGLHLISKKARRFYTEVSYCSGDYLVFGRETSGLPDELLERFAAQTFRIPMVDEPQARSLNLSNAVSVVVYEALRQTNFKNLV